MRISYIYEINKDTKLTSSDVRKKVESAIEQVSKAMKAEQYMSYDQTILYIESIRPFHNPGKPLAHYNAAELSRFLNNDAHFGKLSKSTDNTQVNDKGNTNTKEGYTNKKKLQSMLASFPSQCRR